MSQHMWFMGHFDCWQRSSQSNWSGSLEKCTRFPRRYGSLYSGDLLLTWISLKLNGYLITFIIKCGVKLLIHAPLKEPVIWKCFHAMTSSCGIRTCMRHMLLITSFFHIVFYARHYLLYVFFCDMWLFSDIYCWFDSQHQLQNAFVDYTNQSDTSNSTYST